MASLSSPPGSPRRSSTIDFAPEARRARTAEPSSLPEPSVNWESTTYPTFRPLTSTVRWATTGTLIELRFSSSCSGAAVPGRRRVRWMLVPWAPLMRPMTRSAVAGRTASPLDRGDDVARPHPGPGRRAAREHAADHGLVPAPRDADAHAGVHARVLVAQRGQGLGVEVLGVGVVEALQHLLHRGGLERPSRPPACSTGSAAGSAPGRAARPGPGRARRTSPARRPRPAPRGPGRRGRDGSRCSAEPAHDDRVRW